MTRRRRLIESAKPLFRSLGTKNTDLNKRRSQGKTAKNDVVYEAYLFSLVVEVLHKLGYNPRANPASGTFRFRRAPGILPSTPGRFSFVAFTAYGTNYELHCDTYVETKSKGANLELDVMIVDESEAMDCRSNSRDPNFGHVHLILEAKYIAKGIGTGEAKSFLGIATSIHNGKCCDGLVAAGQVASNARALLNGATPSLHFYAEVTAESAHIKNVVAFQTALLAQLRTVL